MNWRTARHCPALEAQRRRVCAGPLFRTGHHRCDVAPECPRLQNTANGPGSEARIGSSTAQRAASLACVERTRISACRSVALDKTNRLKSAHSSAASPRYRTEARNRFGCLFEIGSADKKPSSSGSSAIRKQSCSYSGDLPRASSLANLRYICRILSRSFPSSALCKTPPPARIVAFSL
jgi:hypothetical protein